MIKSNKKLMLGAGMLCLGLGVAGAFLPLMPAAPFFLLAAFFYARGSRKFYAWLLNHRLFGAYIRNYRALKGIALRHKILMLTLVWTATAWLAWVAALPWWLKLMIGGFALSLTLQVLMIKTRKSDAVRRPPDLPA